MAPRGNCKLVGIDTAGFHDRRWGLGHGQNHTEPRLPSHHLRVSIRCLLERDRLNHGGHAAQRTEAERFVTGRGVPRQGTFELAVSKYEIHGRDLDRLRPDAEDDRDTAGAQPFEGLGDRLPAERLSCA